jgi:exonuclease III
MRTLNQTCSQCDLSIGYWNIDGLFSRINNQRFCKLQLDDVTSAIKKADIFGLVETHCGEEDLESEDFELDNYFKVCNSRPKNRKNNRYYGGIVAFIKKNIKPGVKPLPITSSELLWLKLSHSFFGFEEDIFICYLYISPRYSNFSVTSDSIFDILENDVSKYSKMGKCFLSGDFNARSGTEPDFCTLNSLDKYLQLPSQLTALADTIRNRHNSDNSRVDDHGKQLLSLCRSSGLRIVNGRILGDSLGNYTCFSHTGSPSVIDYMLAHEDIFSIIDSFHVHDPTPHSIHCSLSVIIKTNIPHSDTNFDHTNIDLLSQTPRPIQYKWDEDSNLKFNQSMASPSIQALLNKFSSHKHGLDKEDINSALEDINNIIHQNAKLAKIKCIHPGPRNKTLKNKAKPTPFNKKWYDKDCNLVARQLKEKCKKLRLFPHDQSIIHAYRSKRKEYKKLLKWKKNTFRNKIIDKLDNLRDTQPRAFWKLFNDLKEGPNCKLTTSITPTDWQNHFKKVMNSCPFNSEEDSNFMNYINDNKNKIFNDLNFKITPEEIQKAILKLKPKKACGNDGILNEMLKSSQNHVLPVLTKFFNLIINSGKYPDAWRINFLTPIHKKGSKTVVENYRGIAVGSCLSKLFCSVLLNRLKNYSQLKELIPENQIGYKSKSRTADHMFTLKTVVDKYINKIPRKYLFACFVDFKSAFDTVWRNALLVKLIKLGIGGNMISILQDIYSDVKYSIKLPHGILNAFNSAVGVKQGCVLSPLLFNLYLHDLPSIFNDLCHPVSLHDSKLSCLMFADDLILLSESAIGLQNCLDCLSNYCDKWKLNVNLNKTKVIIFNKGGHNIKKFNFTYKNNQLEIVSNYCYLGITFSSTGNFRLGLESLTDKANKALFKLKQLDVRDNITTALKLFHSLIVPILRYGCEIWSPFLLQNVNKDNFLAICDKAIVEKLNNKYCKYLLGVHKYTSNHAVKGELGSHGLLIGFMCQTIKYWLRVCEAKPGSLLHKTYQENYQLYQENSTNTNWCKNKLVQKHSQYPE